jgi:hypothetical protein
METPTAKEAHELVEQLDKVQKNIVLFHKTKEFCTIHLQGEDGNERQYKFMITHIHQPNLIDAIRDFIERQLYKQLDIIETKIKQL